MSLVAAQPQFAQHHSCDATCARACVILDTTCLPWICSCLRIMQATSLSFINILHFASIFGVVAMVRSQHFQIVWEHFFKHWITLFGVPRSLIFDPTGQFEREFGQELEDKECELMPTAATLHSKTQSVERHGGVCKTHARRLIGECSVKFVADQILPRSPRLPSMTVGTPITSLRFDRALSRAVPARSGSAWHRPCSRAFPGWRRRVLLERQRQGKT